MFKFQAPKDEKALFRVGQKVKCGFYPSKVFKVTGKEWEYSGAVRYALIETTPSWRGLPLSTSGVRQKDLSQA